jgi:hypothetical protein
MARKLFESKIFVHKSVNAVNFRLYVIYSNYKVTTKVKHQGVPIAALLLMLNPQFELH